MELRLIVLISVAVIVVRSDSHSLRYFYTGVSAPGSGLPEFSIVGYVDDQQIDLYSSDSGRARPVSPWMEREGPDYWNRQTQIAKDTEPVYKHNVRTAMSRFNQTGGIHIVQRMYGCELSDDGRISGYEQHGYDGREFMFLDTERWKFIPTMNEAQITTQRWNNPEEREGERYKNYLENECIEWLKKYTEYGRESLEKRVRPEVKVWGRQQSNDVSRLRCLVYGFHPRAVDVKWVRNGIDRIPSDEMTPILPHPDGTYQITVSVEVPTKKKDTYSCHVEHSSLGTETLRVKWEPESGILLMIVGIVCAAVLIILVALGVVRIFLYKKKKIGYKTTRTSDTSSDSSNNPKA